MKKIYLIERTDGCDWDEYDSVVMVAETPRHAKDLAIKGYYGSFKEECIICKLIGTANKKQPIGEVIASFVAG